MPNYYYTKSYFLSIVFFISIVFCNMLYSQELKNSLYNYTDFQEHLSEITNDSLKKNAITDYLLKAKNQQDWIKIADGYYFMSELHARTETAITYADSIIITTKDFNHIRYPGLGYLQKGIQQYYLSKHNEAFDNYVTANKFISKTDNTFQKLRIKHYISLLKNITGEKKEALKTLKENMSFFDSDRNRNLYSDQYLKSLFALADSYNRNEKRDSSLLVSEKGIAESKKYNKQSLYPLFLITHSHTKILKEEYSLSVIDSLKKVSKLLKDNKKSVIDCYKMISLTYKGRKENKMAISYLNKIDSMYQKFPEQLVFEMQYACEELLKLYTRTNDYENKLKTIDKLIVVDSVIVSKFQYLNGEIVNEYDTPQLRKDKEDLIRTNNQISEILKEKERLINRGKKTSKILWILVIGLISLVIYFFTRNKIFKQRFNKLLLEQEKKNSTQTDTNTSNSSENSKKTGLSESQITSILDKLDAFEQSNGFSKRHYTLNSLAKELGTNSAYLSKVINAFKQVNFSNYLNNLKVDYIVTRLTSEKMLTSYTIDAISKEAGFNNAQSFSVAFHKRTGLYPSYFIKKLEQQQKN